MIELSNKINVIMEKYKDCCKLPSLIDKEDLFEILDILVNFRSLYRENIDETYLTSFNIERKFTDFLEQKVAISGIKYNWIFNESGSGSSEYCYSVILPPGKYNLLISNIWKIKTSKVEFTKYNSDDEDDSDDSDDVHFEIKEKGTIKIPQQLYDMYAKTGTNQKDILVHLSVHVCIISGRVCSFIV